MRSGAIWGNAALVTEIEFHPGPFELSGEGRTHEHRVQQFGRGSAGQHNPKPATGRHRLLAEPHEEIGRLLPQFLGILRDPDFRCSAHLTRLDR